MLGPIISDLFPAPCTIKSKELFGGHRAAKYKLMLFYHLDTQGLAYLNNNSWTCLLNSLPPGEAAAAGPDRDHDFQPADLAEGHRLRLPLPLPLRDPPAPLLRHLIRPGQGAPQAAGRRTGAGSGYTGARRETLGGRRWSVCG